MIRCSAFLFSLDEGHFETAKEIAGRLDRHRKGMEAVEGLISGADGTEGRLVALTLDHGEGLPAVHGWVGESAGTGEYSMVSASGGVFEGRRDPFGTRPLYATSSGRCVFSDHRLLPAAERKLVGPGSSLVVGNRTERTRSKPSVGPAPTFDEAVAKLAEHIEVAVRERVKGRGRVAVSFSGGLDSSILAACASRHAEVMACTVSAPGSLDVKSAAKGAEMLGVHLSVGELSRDSVRAELKSLDLPFETSRMDRALWCLYAVSARMAVEAGAGTLLLGQLADELFGGYSKYQATLSDAGPKAAEILMQEDVRGCAERGFVRDEAACSRWLEPAFPFADSRVADFGLSLPVAFKIRDGVRKLVLRRAATLLGVPQVLAESPKKAAQYSSGILKFID